MQRHDGEHGALQPLRPPQPDEIRLEWSRIDEAFEAERSRRGELPCRRGCSACCEGAALFEIGAADVALLRAGLAGLQEHERRGVLARSAEVADAVERAARALEAQESSLSGWQPVEGLATIPSRVRGLLAATVSGACPVLGDGGACLLHAHRPALCRLQGLAWLDEVTGAPLPDACPLTAELPGGVPLDLARLDEQRESFRCGLKGEGPTFIAAAVLAAPPPFT